MCTLIIFRNVFPEHPLIVVSNRDEDPNRPSSPPKVHQRDPYFDPPVFRPTDELKGGTWIGQNVFGLFTAITNRDSVPYIETEYSRGIHLLVTLGMNTTARGANEMKRYTYQHQENGFHMVLIDSKDAFLVTGHGDKNTCEPISNGLTVITNYGTTPGHCERAMEIERRASYLIEQNEYSPKALNQLLDFHSPNHTDPKSAGCVHRPHDAHSTVSSMIIRTDTKWTAFESWYREGPACSGDFTQCPTFYVDTSIDYNERHNAWVF